MSAKVTGKVWELDLDPMDKLVLLALADHADHQGENVRPGNELLVAKTGLSEKTIGLKLRSFVEQGILQEVFVKAGRGNIRQYSIDVSGMNRRAYFVWKDNLKVEGGSTFQPEKKSKVVQPLVKQKVELDGGKVEAASAFPDEERSNLTTERSNLTDQKVEPDAVKVEVDGITCKEGTVMNRHEPSVEPGKRARAQEPAPLKKPLREEPPDPVLAQIERLEAILFRQYSLGPIDQNFERLVRQKTGKLNAMGCTPELLTEFLDRQQDLPKLRFVDENWQAWAINRKRAVNGPRPASGKLVGLGPRQATQASAPISEEQILEIAEIYESCKSEEGRSPEENEIVRQAEEIRARRRYQQLAGGAEEQPDPRERTGSEQ